MRVPAAAVATLIAVAMEEKLSTLSFAFLGKSFLLWPQPVEPLLGIAWTLEFEILFYAIVGIAIVNLRCGIAVMLAWGIGIVAATTATIDGKAQEIHGMACLQPDGTWQFIH